MGSRTVFWGFQDWNIEPLLCSWPFSSSRVKLWLSLSSNPEERWRLWTRLPGKTLILMAMHCASTLPLFFILSKVSCIFIALFLISINRKTGMWHRAYVLSAGPFIEIRFLPLCFDIKPHLMSHWDSHNNPNISRWVSTVFPNLPTAKILTDFENVFTGTSSFSFDVWS